jgi:hypothetical protein
MSDLVWVAFIVRHPRLKRSAPLFPAERWFYPKNLKRSIGMINQLGQQAFGNS